VAGSMDSHPALTPPRAAPLPECVTVCGSPDICWCRLSVDETVYEALGYDLETGEWRQP
jgi:hypothetical protein